MEPAERSKKRVQPWLRAAVHFSLCFAMGALAALAPLAVTGAPSAVNIRESFFTLSGNAQRVAPAPPALPDIGLQLIVTVTRPDGDMAQDASLARLPHTLRHVVPPLLWIVVGAENRTATARAVRVLRGTGVVFRHLTYDAGNFTYANAGDEADHQRNVALSHIERHRLHGVVHLAGASGVYDLRFFQELRKHGYAAWPVATVSTTEQRMTVEGPICNSAQITGWCREDSRTNGTQRTTMGGVDTSASNEKSCSENPKINMSGFGFRSSILWDSERSLFRRNSSAGATRDFIQFVRQTVSEGENKLKGIPFDCSDSQIMLWNLDMPRFVPKIEDQETRQQQSPMKSEEDDLTT